MRQQFYTAQWDRIKRELRSGSTRSHMKDLKCDICQLAMDMNSVLCFNIALLHCGHICHETCAVGLHVDALKSLTRRPVYPCCSMPIKHQGCTCTIAYRFLPESFRGLDNLDSMQRNGPPTTCFWHDVQSGLRAIGLAALDRLDHKLIGVAADSQTCLVSARGVCFGRRGVWTHSPRTYSCLREMREQEALKIETEHAGKWSGSARAVTKPEFTIGVMPEPTGETCWNCQKPECRNGLRVKVEE